MIRTAGNIVPNLMSIAQGSYYLLNLHSGKRIIRINWTVPMSADAISPFQLFTIIFIISIQYSIKSLLGMLVFENTDCLHN